MAKFPSGKALSPEDERKIGLHLRATRGELLFARSWLLVEGATEIWLFEGIAEILDVDLERKGVRLVQYAQVMPEPFIRLADDLGIPWFCYSDGDQDGIKYRDAASALLNSRPPTDHVLALQQPTVEVYLCEAGFGSVYEAEIAEQKRATVTAAPGDPLYWGQVVRATPNRGKEARAIKVIEEMRRRGPSSVPPVLKDVLERAVQLAGRSNGG